MKLKQLMPAMCNYWLLLGLDVVTEGEVLQYASKLACTIHAYA
jgi:hypothetical protein